MAFSLQVESKKTIQNNFLFDNVFLNPLKVKEIWIQIHSPLCLKNEVYSIAIVVHFMVLVLLLKLCHGCEQEHDCVCRVSK